MSTVPSELVKAISDRTYDMFFRCLLGRVEPPEVIERVSVIIRAELDKHQVIYTDEDVHSMALQLGVKFLDAMKQFKPATGGASANDDTHTLH